MLKNDYEIQKRYLVDGFDVSSEIISDKRAEDNQEMRAILIRSSCKSDKWGVRKIEHSMSAPIAYKGFVEDLERIRSAEAERVVRIEQGKIPEKPPANLLIKIHAPNGRTLKAVAGFHLGISPCLMNPGMIEALGLENTGETYGEWLNGQMCQIPKFRICLEFDELFIDTTVLPSDHQGIGLILGGDFFQKATADRPDRVYELLLSEQHRALVSAARCKESHVLVLGPYGKYREQLNSIKNILAQMCFVPLILDEHSDIEQQTLAHKMLTYASMCRFVLVLDIAPSGHIGELEICRQSQFITAILRPDGHSSSNTQSNITDEVSYMHSFSYSDEEHLEAAIRQAADWVDTTIRDRVRNLNTQYGWRSPENLMR